MYFGYRLCNKLKKNVFLCINIITNSVFANKMAMRKPAYEAKKSN